MRKERDLVLEKNLQTLLQDLELGPLSPPDENKNYSIEIGNTKISLKDLSPGVYFRSLIAPIPTEKKEEFFITVMKANFLGIETGGSTIGMLEDETFLTLSSAFPYEMDYKSFKEALEDFCNFINYWKKKTENWNSN